MIDFFKNTTILNPFSVVIEKKFNFPLSEVYHIFCISKNKTFINCINFKIIINDNLKILDKNNIVDFFNLHFDEIKKQLEVKNYFEIPKIVFINPIDVMVFLFFIIENKNKLTEEKYKLEFENYLLNIENNLNLKWKDVGHQIEMYTKYN